MNAIRHLIVLLAAIAPLAPTVVSAASPITGLRWSYATGAHIYYSSPAIAPDGTIHVGNGASLPGATEGAGVFALNPDGTLKWKLTTTKNMFTPAVGADGTVYIQDSQSTLHAIDAAGALKWTFALNATSFVGQVAPAIAQDGTIYVGASALHAVNPDGSSRWSNPLSCGGSVLCAPSFVRSSPAIAPDATIYVGATGTAADPGPPFVSGNAWMTAVNPDGTTKWFHLLEGTNATLSSPAIGPDGTVYLGAEISVAAGAVYAINPDGTRRWTYATNNVVHSSPAVGMDGTVYVATKARDGVNAAMLALTPDGTLRWSYTIPQVHTTPDDTYNSPAIGADGTIYFAAETGLLYALNPDGSLAGTYATPEIAGFGNSVTWSSPAIAADGTVYFGNNNGYVFAVTTTSSGTAASSWPKFRHDNRNTGKAVSTPILATPDPFNFVDQANVLPGAEITSAPVTITGINVSVPVTVADGTYSVGCSGIFTSSAGRVSGGQSVCVRHTASSALAGTASSTLTVGGVSDTFSSTTIATNPARLGNISTRGQVLTGDNVMIGGFIIGGSAPKTVLVRARGPSMIPAGVLNAMANPQLTLVAQSTATIIGTNDNWGEAVNATAIAATGKAPTNAFESAILVSLNPGAYTAVVSGVGGTTGVGIVEVFEIDHPEVPLTNISTRGRVLTGDDVMIGGFIIDGDNAKAVLIRARGPSMIPAGVTDALPNPQVTLVNQATASIIGTNDNWGDATNATAITATGLAPTNALESAILVTLQPGAYTVVVSGVGGTTGVGIVEVFAQ